MSDCMSNRMSRWMSRWVLILSLPLGLTLSSCGYYHISKQKPESGIQNLSKATLSYDTVKAAVLKPYCLQCHSVAGGNRGRVNLESFENVVMLARSIRADVLSSAMPDDGPMPQQEIELIVAWIDAGTPLASDLPVPGQKADPTPEPTDPVPPSNPAPPVNPPAQPLPTPAPPISFESVRSRLFEPLCVECHSSFNTYARVSARIKSIQTAIETDEMPQDGPPVSDELKQLLEEWIAQGSPEN